MIRAIKNALTKAKQTVEGPRRFQCSAQYWTTDENPTHVTCGNVQEIQPTNGWPACEKCGNTAWMHIGG